MSYLEHRTSFTALRTLDTLPSAASPPEEARREPSAAPAVRPVEFSIVSPTLNERENIAALVQGIERAMGDAAWELIVVDDNSPDGTAELVRDLHCTDGRVRVLKRIGRRGLASACLEGWLASSAPYLAVIDADGQHDPGMLPALFGPLKEGRADLVVASRYAKGASISDWERRRAQHSRIATKITLELIPTGTTDPMSGFFALRREVMEDAAPRISGRGFKILLEILVASARPIRMREVPITFRPRVNGASKMSSPVIWDWLTLVVEGATRGAVSPRLFTYLSVGTAGLLVQLLVAAVLFRGAGLPFQAAQAVAVLSAVISNYSLNTWLTFADRRRTRWTWASGLLAFTMVCGSGAAANWLLADFMFKAGAPWLLAAAAGAAVASVLNYVATSRVSPRSRR